MISHRLNLANFNPRSPCGERPFRRGTQLCRSTFQPTLPVRGATGSADGFEEVTDISTHAPRAGSDIGARPGRLMQSISTHAPRAGSDFEAQPYAYAVRISTHAPRAGSDHPAIVRRGFLVRFQPTLPVRGATSAICRSSPLIFYFNPRSPCGERLNSARGTKSPADFNPRSPCGERLDLPRRGGLVVAFQPTLPVRGATLPIIPRRCRILFQPTLPVRGAT